MASRVDDQRIRPLGLIDMTVDRNAFGRQRESFEADLPVDRSGWRPFHAIFIRAPLLRLPELVFTCSHAHRRGSLPLNRESTWLSLSIPNLAQTPGSMTVLGRLGITVTRP